MYNQSNIARHNRQAKKQAVKDIKAGLNVCAIALGVLFAIGIIASMASCTEPVRMKNIQTGTIEVHHMEETYKVGDTIKLEQSIHAGKKFVVVK